MIVCGLTSVLCCVLCQNKLSALCFSVLVVKTKSGVWKLCEVFSLNVDVAANNLDSTSISSCIRVIFY